MPQAAMAEFPNKQFSLPPDAHAGARKTIWQAPLELEAITRAISMSLDMRDADGRRGHRLDGA
jgi:hypothetical protein